jgi:hypothetical protein
VVPKQLDIQAIAELSVLGCSFGQRTPYRDIQCLRSAEIITFSSSSVQAVRYWHWDQLPVSTLPEPELLHAAHAAFGAATASLARQDKTAFSFLTGGMDSRCVVASLRERGMTVQTFAFGSARSQEKTFAAEYAKQAGTIHHEGPYDRRPGEPLPSMLGRYLENVRLAEPLPERPRLIWSGNGGSVGLGCVYITPVVVDRLRAHDMSGAIKQYIAEMRAYPALRLLKSSLRAQLKDIPMETIQAELDAIGGDDPVQRFYWFLMFNDQRRHLYGLYEEIHKHRMELALPFMDSDFVKVIGATPIELRLMHRFYAKWMYYFDSSVTSTPWQTYPGHVSCPLTKDESLSYQWTPATIKQLTKVSTSQTLQDIEMALKQRSFPPALSRTQLLLSALIHRAGLRDHDSFLKAARTYVTYWAHCISQDDAPALDMAHVRIQRVERN